MKKAFIFLQLIVFGFGLGILGSAAADVAVKSAGIGVEDREEDPSYSLKLVFFEEGGPYVANVAVSILDQNGKEIVHQTSHGPWFYVGLSAGKYRVIATRQDGQFRGATFEIGDKQKEVALMFEKP